MHERADERIANQTQQVKDQLLKQFSDEINGKTEYAVGEELDIDTNGEKSHVVVTGQNDDGTYTISDGVTLLQVSGQWLQSAGNRAAIASLRSEQPYRFNQELTLNVDGSDVQAVIVSEMNDDGRYEVQTENNEVLSLSAAEIQTLESRVNAGNAEETNEKSVRLEKLRNSEPIEITGKEIEPSDDLKQYRKNALEYGKTLRGEYVNEDTGVKITLTGGSNSGGLREILHHHYKDAEHLQSIAAIPQIIEKSTYIDTIANDDTQKHPDIVSYDYYVCGLRIGRTDYTVKAIVANSTMGVSYYDHRLTQIEKGALISGLPVMISTGLDTNTPNSGFTPKVDSIESDPSYTQYKDKRLISILQNNLPKSEEISDEVSQEGTPSVIKQLPIDDKGNMIFELADTEVSANALIEMNDGDRAEALDSAMQMISSLSKQLEREKNTKPKAKAADINAIQQAKAHKKVTIVGLQTKLDYWQGVAGILTANEQSDAVDNNAVTPQVADDQKQQKNKNQRSKSLFERVVPDREELPVEDKIIHDIATGSVVFLWDNDKSGTPGVQNELYGSRKGRFGGNNIKLSDEFSSKVVTHNANKGITPSAYAERLYEERTTDTDTYDDTVYRDMVLDALGQVTSRKQAKQFLIDKYTVDYSWKEDEVAYYAEQERLDEKNKQDIILDEIESLGEDLVAIDNIFAEDYFNSENNTNFDETNHNKNGRPAESGANRRNNGEEFLQNRERDILARRIRYNGGAKQHGHRSVYAAGETQPSEQPANVSRDEIYSQRNTGADSNKHETFSDRLSEIHSQNENTTINNEVNTDFKDTHNDEKGRPAEPTDEGVRFRRDDTQIPERLSQGADRKGIEVDIRMEEASTVVRRSKETAGGIGSTEGYKRGQIEVLDSQTNIFRNTNPSEQPNSAVDFDKEFQDVENDYNTLVANQKNNPNFERDLNDWRDRKVEVVHSYLTSLADDYGINNTIFVLNGERDVDSVKMLLLYAEPTLAEDEIIHNVAEFQRLKSIGGFDNVSQTIFIDISKSDSINRKNEYQKILVHELTHSYVDRFLSKDDKEIAYDECKDIPAFKKIFTYENYSNLSKSDKGDEALAYCISGMCATNNGSISLLDRYMNSELSGADIVSRIKFTTPKINKILINILNEFSDERDKQRGRENADSFIRTGAVPKDIAEWNSSKWAQRNRSDSREYNNRGGRGEVDAGQQTDTGRDQESSLGSSDFLVGENGEQYVSFITGSDQDILEYDKTGDRPSGGEISAETGSDSLIRFNESKSIKHERATSPKREKGTIGIRQEDISAHFGFRSGIRRGNRRVRSIGEQGESSKRNYSTREIISATTELSNKLNTPVRIIENVDDITDPNQRTQQQKRKAKGWYDLKTGEVVVVSPNNADIADVTATILHEVVGHKGLRQMFGEDFDGFLDNVLKNGDAETRKKIAAKAVRLKLDTRLATEEYLAELAEEGIRNPRESSSVWQTIRNAFAELLRKVGINVQLSDNDLRYVLWKSYNRLKDGDNTFVRAVKVQQDTALKSAMRNAEDQYHSEVDRIISTAKANNNYLLAPNGKRTNLSPKQWAQVRTKAFKEWFGDWEKATRIEKLRNSEPIIASGEEYNGLYELNNRSANKYIINNLRGNYINADTGNTIIISRKGADKVTRHDAESDPHLKSVALIPQMIEKAIFITEENNDKLKNGFESYRYYVVGLKLGDVDYTAKLAVGVKNSETYYDHALTEIEKSNLIKGIDLIKRRFADDEVAASDIKDKRLISILQNNSSKVIDANGEPIVNDEIRYRELAKDIEIVTCPPNSFKNFGEAKSWAKENIVRTYSNKETGGKGDIRISNKAVDKYLSGSSINGNESKDTHLSVLQVLPQVIKESVDAEQHKDYTKDKFGRRSPENGFNENVTIHRLYGAANVGEDI